MSRSNGVGSAELGFGDVVQFGDPIPGSDNVRWYPGIEVVLGPTAHNTTTDLSVWPVIFNDEGDPYIDMPATNEGDCVRLYGTLSVEEVSGLLRRGWQKSPLAAKKGVDYIINVYIASEPRPRERYDFVLHEVIAPSFENTMQLLRDMRAKQDSWFNR